MRFRLLLVSALLLAGVCAEPIDIGAATAAASAKALPAGRYDNSAQIAKPPADPERPIPHVTVVIEATPQKDWSLWHVHLSTDAETSYDQTWAMQTRIEHDGSTALIPYYQLKQTETPAAATFDPQSWLSLEACALRGDFGKPRIEAMSEGEPCVAVSMSVGARRALLPVGFVYEGETLHLDMNLRGARTRIDANRM